MKLYEYLEPELVILDVAADSVESTIRSLVRPLGRKGMIADEDAVVGALLQREELQSTGIGHGVAIPHAACRELTEPLITLGLSKQGIGFSSPDSEPIHILFLLLSPPERTATHIKLLARIARLMRLDEHREELLSAASAPDAIARLRRLDDLHP